LFGLFCVRKDVLEGWKHAFGSSSSTYSIDFQQNAGTRASKTNLSPLERSSQELLDMDMAPS